MRKMTLLCCVALLAAATTTAFAEDAVPLKRKHADPSPQELARMVLFGNQAEQALVVAWIEKADRDTLRAVFSALRKLRRNAPQPMPEARRLPPRPPTPPGFTRTPEGRLQPKFPTPEKGKEITLINSEMRIIDVDADAAAAFFGKHRPTMKRKVVHLDRAQAAALIAKLENSKTAKQVTAPRITVYDGQKANVSVLNKVSYIKDFDVEVNQTERVIDPIVGVIQEGSVIDFTPHFSAKSGSIGIKFDGTFAAMTRPIPEFTLPKTVGHKGEPLKIQVPELKVSKVSTTFYVKDGGFVLIGGNRVFEPKKGEKMERVTLVHVKAIKMKSGELEDFVGKEIRLKPAK